MARVTVEDCVKIVENRFDLVVLAAHRSRLISSGAVVTVERENDKNPVVALREIADGTVDPEMLDNSLVTSFQQHGSVNSQDEHGQAQIIEDTADDDSLSEEDALHVMMATGMKDETK